MKIKSKWKLKVSGVLVGLAVLGLAVLLRSIGLESESIAPGSGATTPSKPNIQICTGSRQIGDYYLEDPYLSYKPFLILAEIYTPEKLAEWQEMVQNNESLNKEFELIRNNNVYREKCMIQDVICRSLQEKRDKNEISAEEFRQEKEKVYPQVDTSWGEDENFNKYDLLAAVNAGDEQATINGLNKMLEFEQFVLNISRDVLQARKNIVNNPYISKDNKYFDVHLYDEKCSEKEGKVTYYDEDLFNLVQRYTPENIAAWEQVLDEHKNKVRDYMRRTTNKNKKIDEGLLTAREKLHNGEISTQAFKDELMTLVEQTFLYNYYVGSVKESRAKQAELGNEGHSDQKWHWGDYSDVLDEVTEALESDNTQDIKNSLDKLLKARQELQQYDGEYDYSFILSTIILCK